MQQCAETARCVAWLQQTHACMCHIMLVAAAHAVMRPMRACDKAHESIAIVLLLSLCVVVLLLAGCHGYSSSTLQADAQAAGDGQGAAAGERGPQAALCMRWWWQEQWLWRRHAHRWWCAAVYLRKASFAVWLRADADGEHNRQGSEQLPQHFSSLCLNCYQVQTCHSIRIAGCVCVAQFMFLCVADSIANSKVLQQNPDACARWPNILLRAVCWAADHHHPTAQVCDRAKPNTWWRSL